MAAVLRGIGGNILGRTADLCRALCLLPHKLFRNIINIRLVKKFKYCGRLDVTISLVLFIISELAIALAGRRFISLRAHGAYVKIAVSDPARDEKLSGNLIFLV